MPDSHEETVLSLAVDKGIRPTITRLTDEIKRLRAALAEAKAQAKRDALEEGRQQGLEKAAKVGAVRERDVAIAEAEEESWECARLALLLTQAQAELEKLKSKTMPVATAPKDFEAQKEKISDCIDRARRFWEAVDGATAPAETEKPETGEAGR